MKYITEPSRFKWRTGTGIVICAFVLFGFGLRGLSAESIYLIEAESPFIGKSLDLEIGGLIGYESGYIPDLLVQPELSVGLFNFLQIGATVSLVYFPDQELFRFSSYRFGVKAKIIEFERQGGLYLFGFFKHGVGEPVIVDYEGRLPDVTKVVSPRSDAGIDYGGGIGTFVPLALLSDTATFALLAEADFTRTELREYDPRFETEAYKNRLFGTIAPALHVDGSFLFGLQNRITYWFERGFSYELLPQIVLETGAASRFTVGASFPVASGDSWKIYAGFSGHTDGQALPLPLPEPDKEVLVINEGSNIRIRAYLNFLGDTADLFAPLNRKFDAQNRCVVDKIDKLLRAYPHYDIVIEGHTNRSKFSLSFDQEQSRELLPLGKARADAVMRALLARGFLAARMSTVSFGALKPLAPFTDKDNVWMNRRVEILLKPKR